MRRLRNTSLVGKEALAGIRRSTAVGALGQQHAAQAIATDNTKCHREVLGASSAAGSSAFFSTIPKRVYQSAPKRRHGRHAGWRKWSAPTTKHTKKDRADQPAGAMAAVDDATETQVSVVDGLKEKEEERKRELREVSAKMKEIRVSPWKLNLLAKVVRNLPVVDAMAQMEFCKKKHTVTFQKIIKVRYSTHRLSSADRALIIFLHRDSSAALEPTRFVYSKSSSVCCVCCTYSTQLYTCALFVSLVRILLYEVYVRSNTVDHILALLC